MRLGKTSIWLVVFLVLIASRCQYLSQPYFDRFDARAEVGDLPDVGYVEVYRAPSYITDGSLLSLDDQFDSAIANADPLLISFFQRDGSTYGLPRDFQTLALLVNMDQLNEAGRQNPPEDWDDLLAASQDVASLGGFGFGINPSFWSFLPFVYQAGGSFVDGSGTRVTLQSSESVAALEFYIALATDGGGLVVEESVENPLDRFPYRPTRLLVEAFAQGQAAMVVAPNVTYQFLSEQSLGFHFVVAELPSGPDGRATLPYVAGFGMHDPEALNSEAAIAFLNFIAGPLGQEIWIESPIYMPADLDLREAWRDLHPEATAFMAGADYMVNYQPQAMSFDAIAEFDAEAAVIMAEALRGEIDPESAIARMADAAQQMIGE